MKPEGEYLFRVTPRNRYGWGEAVVSDSITIGKFDELPEFIKTLPGQLKVLYGSDVTLDCEVRYLLFFFVLFFGKNETKFCVVLGSWKS